MKLDQIIFKDRLHLKSSTENMSDKWISKTCKRRSSWRLCRSDIGSTELRKLQANYKPQFQ